MTKRTKELLGIYSAVAVWGGSLLWVCGAAAQAPQQVVGAFAPINAPAFTGGITVTGVIGGTSDIFAGAAGAIYFNGRTQMLSASNGNFELTNQARTGFTNLQLGCTAATCPELLVSGNTIGIRGADGTLPVFSSLPACAAGTAGQMAWITDSSTAVFAATITGSGANKVLAICDGTNWTVH